MTKNEFLEKLKKALANDLSGPVIQENVSYYNEYISGEVRKGRSEAEVTAELGDPWAIAKTIIDSVGNQSDSGAESYEARRQTYQKEQNHTGGRVHILGLDSWWKKLLLVLGIIGVFALITAVIGGIFSLLAPVAVPLLLIYVLARTFGGRRR